MNTPWNTIARAILAGILALGICNPGLSAEPAKAVKPKAVVADDDIQHLLYLAEDRLVVFRLHVRVDGKSYAAVSKEMIDRFFKELDANKDGVLTGDEQKGLPTASSLQRSGIAGFARSFRLPTFSQNSADSSPRDGKVTKKELLAYLDRIGIRPFSVRIAESGGNNGQQVIALGMQNQPAAAGKKLFRLLDLNDDGKLTRDELEAAQKSLRKADLDDDETISAAELLPPSSPFIAGGMSAGNGRAADTGLFLSLSSGQSQAQMVRRLIERYDRPAKSKGKSSGSTDGKLDRTELAIDAAAFSRFDQDGDSRLDFDELRQFLRDPPPSVELVLRFGRRTRGEQIVEVIRTDAGLKSLVRKVTGELANLRLKNSQIDIGGVNAWVGRAPNSEENLKAQFKQADSDNNGYVDKMESRRYGLFVNTFEEMDADKDGKVFLKEMLAYFRRQESLAKSQTILNIADQGRDLFQILDSDRDGRLSVSELETLPGRLDAWDDDSDRGITISEIPQQYRMSLSQGQVNGNPNQFVAFSTNAGGRQPRARNNGPKWFTRMDVNNDGEVSSREFLGKPALFKKLDKNGNGRLDASEAAAVKK